MGKCQHLLMLWHKQSICPARERECRLGIERGEGLLGEGGHIFIKKHFIRVLLH